MENFELKDRLQEINDEQEAFLKTAKHRYLTDDEIEKTKSLRAEANTIESYLESTQSLGKQTGPNVLNDGIDRSGPKPVPYRAAARATGPNGFKSLGEFAIVAKDSARPGAVIGRRLVQNAPSTISTEGVGSDGGFAVPPQYVADIAQTISGEESLLGRCFQIITPSNTIVMPKDTTTPWQTSGGVQVFWKAEASQIDQSKIALEEETLRLSKIIALVPVSEELMEDSPSLDAYLRRKLPEKIDFAITKALIEGTGAGQPTGILNSACLVTVDKESGQAADSPQFENIVNMWARMYGPCRSRAVWLVNQDLEPQLFTMAWEGASSSLPVYLPANSAANQPYGTLFGRPVIPTQACKTLGDKGDIFLADFSQYFTALKSGGVRAEVSIHLWFDYDVTAYKFSLRIAGQPFWTSAASALNSSNTLSPFVTLAERA